MPVYEIEELRSRLVEQLLPIRIYLFGSFAAGTYTDKSDLDLYIIVGDDVSDLAAETVRAYKAIRRIKRRPVDIIVGTQSRFEARKQLSTVENEVYQKGVLLYDSGNERMI